MSKSNPVHLWRFGRTRALFFTQKSLNRAKTWVLHGTPNNYCNIVFQHLLFNVPLRVRYSSPRKMSPILLEHKLGSRGLLLSNTAVGRRVRSFFFFPIKLPIPSQVFMSGSTCFSPLFILTFLCISFQAHYNIQWRKAKAPIIKLFIPSQVLIQVSLNPPPARALICLQIYRSISLLSKQALHWRHYEHTQNWCKAKDVGDRVKYNETSLQSASCVEDFAFKMGE